MRIKQKEKSFRVIRHKNQAPSSSNCE